MDENHRKILRQSWHKLRQDVEPRKLLSCLGDVLDQEDVEEIRGKEKREDRCDMLLDTLQRSGPKAFGALIKALENTSQAHLAFELTNQSGKNLFCWLICLSVIVLRN